MEPGPAFTAVKDGDGSVFGAIGWVGAWHAFVITRICDLDALDVVCAEAHGLLCKRALHFVISEIRNIKHGDRNEILGHWGWAHMMVDAGHCWEFDSAKDKDLTLVGQDAHAAYAMMLDRQSLSMAHIFMTAITHI